MQTNPGFRLLDEDPVEIIATGRFAYPIIWHSKSATDGQLKAAPLPRYVRRDKFVDFKLTTPEIRLIILPAQRVGGSHRLS
jgi:hypothetical protein